MRKRKYHVIRAKPAPNMGLITLPRPFEASKGLKPTLSCVLNISPAVAMANWYPLLRYPVLSFLS